MDEGRCSSRGNKVDKEVKGGVKGLDTGTEAKGLV